MQGGEERRREKFLFFLTVGLVFPIFYSPSLLANEGRCFGSGICSSKTRMVVIRHPV